MKPIAIVLLFIALTTAAGAQGGDRQQFIRTEAPVIALINVSVIDGTGAAPLENQTIVIRGGKIDLIGPTAATTIPAGAENIDLKGYSVLPGLVGMHNHLFFPQGGNPPIYSDMAINLPPALPRSRRHNDPNDRQRYAVHRYRNKTANRRGENDRA
jgi:hypothetical protein